MQRIAYVVILFLGAILIAPAQGLHIYSGANLGQDWMSLNIFGQDSSNLFGVKRDEEKYLIVKFDKESLSKKSEIKIPLPDRDTMKYYLENLFVAPGRFQVFYSYFDRVELNQKLEMVSFDTMGNQIGERKLIDYSEAKNERRAGNFNVYNDSPNNGFLSYHYASKRRIGYVDIDYFDYSGNKTGTKQFELDRSGSTIKSLLDNRNNLYQVVRGNGNESRRHFSIRIYGLHKDSVIVIPLRKAVDSGIFLSDFFRLVENSDSTVFVFTPYTTSSFSKYSKGIYLVQLSAKTGTLLTEKIIPFKEGEAETKDAKPNDFDLSSCIITNVISLKNGKLMILFESRLRTTTSFYGAKVSEVYDINEIITVELNTVFVVTDIHKIGKRQRTGPSTSIYTGFAVLISENEIFYIYNELQDNLGRAPADFERLDSKELEDAVVIATSVKDDKVKREVVGVKDFKKETDVIMPGTAYKDNNENVIYIYRKIKLNVYLSKIYL